MTNQQKAQQLYKNKKVLILGLGVNQGGVGAARFFAQAGSQLRVTDLKTKEVLADSLEQLSTFSNIEYILGEHRNEDIDWADLIIRNPALKADNPYLIYAQSQNKQIEMDLGIFLQFVDPQMIIGVTGTKGKSTTSALIHLVLKEQGVPVIFAGNIGRSMLDTISMVDDRTFVVLELSSFQLQALDTHNVSPHRSVITNIYPDHLNYHGTMEEYIRAKKLIGQFQTPDDLIFLNKENAITGNQEFAVDLPGQKFYFSEKDLPEDYHPVLVGDHNRYNIAAAIAVAKSFGLDQEKSLELLKTFTGVEFRMQLVKEYKGIKIYNDTAATMPKAAEENIKSLPGAIVIAGGMDKGLSYVELAKVLDQYPKAVYFLIGDATDKMKELMTAHQKIQGEYDSLEAVLTDVLTAAQSGDTILFCPGATSFNLFQNEFDRGRKFNAALEKLTGDK